MLPPIVRKPPPRWTSVGIYVVIALVAVTFEVFLLKKTSPTDLTTGAGLTMLLYLTVGAFLIGATRVFVTRRGSDDQHHT